ncbi:MAG: hypothetical protein WCE57_02160 [Salegentibacter sp.]
MKTISQLKLMMSLVLICFTTGLMAQDQTDQELSQKLYQEYQENGIDKALDMYNKSSAKGNEYTGMSEPLNILAYRIMMDSHDMEAAKKAFKAQIEEYPDKANPMDSYADLLIEEGDKEQAKEYLKKSVALAENSDNEQENTEVYRASKAKLAHLENKDRKLDFLIGTWNTDLTSYQDGKETNKSTGYTTSTDYDEDNGMMNVVIKDPSGNPVAKRIVVYDALDDAYDMAYIDPTQPLGIRTSTIKVKDMGDNKYEFMENYTTRDGKEKTARHELKKNEDGNLEWVIYDKSEDGSDWEKVAVYDYKKSM